MSISNILFLYLRVEIYIFYIILVWVLIYLINIYFYSLSLKVYIKFFIIPVILLILYDLIYNPIEQIESIYYLNNYFIYNNSIAHIQIIMLIILLFYFIILLNYSKYINLPYFEYTLLILLTFFGLQIMVICNHLFLILLFLELVNLCIYCLLALNKVSNFGIEVSYKYFVQSAFSTILGFFALSILSFSLGTLDLHELSLLVWNDNLWSNYISQIAIFWLTLNFFFKLGLFPLHSWVADVYQASLIITALFIATLPKVAYIFVFFKLLLSFSEIISYFSLMLAFCTIIYGSLITLYQTNIKRLIGYGSMVHVGFIIYSMSLYSIDGLSAAFFYLFIYILLIYFVFSFFLYLFEINNNKDLFFIENISQLNNIFNKNKLIISIFVLILFSFAGLPFFIGFLAKWSIFLNLIINNKYIELGILLIISLISTVYYIRIIRFLFFFEMKINTVYMYNTLKNNNIFLLFVLFLFFLNIFLIFYYSSIYVYIWKDVYFYFK